jgi:transcriptional regulator with XRE-family HTH domain
MNSEERMVLRDRAIGVLLRDARTRAEKSKRECAAALGVSTGTISAYEEGRRSISLPEMEVLAYFLDVPVAHFWDPEGRLLAEEGLPPLQSVMELRHRIVGALLRQARLEADKSQKELAESLGCPSRRISTYEYGERPIPLRDLEVLAQVLDCPLAYFLDEQSGPVGEWEREQELYRRFRELPDDLCEFIVRPINRSYLELALKLAEMPAGALRDIAEGLLDITF